MGVDLPAYRHFRFHRRVYGRTLTINPSNFTLHEPDPITNLNGRNKMIRYKTQAKSEPRFGVR